HDPPDEFRRLAGAAVRREARRRMASGLLGRHGRAAPYLRPHEGFLPATARAWWTPGRVADRSGGARNVLGARAMAPVEISAEADSRSGASVARVDDQHQVQPHSGRMAAGLRAVSKTDRVSARAQTSRVPGARRTWNDGACEHVVVQRRRRADLS